MSFDIKAEARIWINAILHAASRTPWKQDQLEDLLTRCHDAAVRERDREWSLAWAKATEVDTDDGAGNFTPQMVREAIGAANRAQELRIARAVRETEEADIKLMCSRCENGTPLEHRPDISYVWVHWVNCAAVPCGARGIHERRRKREEQG